MRVYLASQIFAECWRDYNEKLAQRIEEEFPSLELYVPQRNKDINDKTKCANSLQITTGDFTNNLDHDDLMIAVLDGDTPGIGTTLEIGYFARMCEEEIQRQGYTTKKIIALYTDSRECSSTYLEAKNELLKERAECQYSYLNLLLVGAIKRYGVMCRTIDEVVDEVRKHLNLLVESTIMKVGQIITTPQGVAIIKNLEPSENVNETNITLKYLTKEEIDDLSKPEPQTIEGEVVNDR